MSPVDDSATTRVLAMHLTRPSSSEAKVLGLLLKDVDPDIDVHLVVNRDGAGDLATHLSPELLSERVRLEALNVGLPVDPAAPDSAVLRLLSRSLYPILQNRVVQLARDRAVDVVYTSQQRFDCQIGALVARRLGIPHIIHLHYLPGPWLRERPMRLLHTCDQVIAVSEFIRRRAIDCGISRERIEVIRNTLELPALSAGAGKRRSIVIGQIGRMHPMKGFLDTVQAFSRVHARHLNTSLVLVGDGVERPAIERAIAEADLSDVSRMVGWQDDSNAWLRELDIFVHPSRDEPFGLAVVEAMAHGIPVVAYGDGGVGEIVEHGQSGFLVEPGNISALTATIEQLVSDGHLRAQVGERARERVRNAFDPAGARQAFAALVRRVAGRHRIDPVAPA
jgi:glycosyltransferase involved in cell wall biosynthesis